MHIVNVKQNTAPWKVWRQAELGCLGASHAPAICGVDKYTSYRMLYEQMVNGAPSNISEYIADKALFFETRSHAMSGIVLKYQYERDICAEHDECRFLRASFDGINFEEKRFWENKYCGVKEFEAVKEGPNSIVCSDSARIKADIILCRYLPQLAQQAFVSGYRVCDFTVYNDQADDVANIEVHLTEEFITSVTQKVFAFRHLLLTKTLPPLMPMDTLCLTGEKDIKLFSDLLHATRSQDKKRALEIRTLISNSMPHNKIECLGVHVIKSKDGKVVFRNLKAALAEAAGGESVGHESRA